MLLKGFHQTMENLQVQDKSKIFGCFIDYQSNWSKYGKVLRQKLTAAWEIHSDICIFHFLMSYWGVLVVSFVLW